MASQRRPSPALRWLCLLALVSALAAVQAAPKPQLASSADAAGDTIVYSAGTDAAGDPSTTILETISAATDAAADTAVVTTTDAAGAVATTSTTSVISQNLGQVASAPETSSTSSVPPTTYLVYYTVDGVQTSGYSTFVASYATTPSPIAPSAGSIIPYSAYFTATSTSKSGAKKMRTVTSGGAVAGVGLLLSIALGAVMVL